MRVYGITNLYCYRKKEIRGGLQFDCSMGKDDGFIKVVILQSYVGDRAYKFNEGDVINVPYGNITFKKTKNKVDGNYFYSLTLFAMGIEYGFSKKTNQEKEATQDPFEEENSETIDETFEHLSKELGNNKQADDYEVVDKTNKEEPQEQAGWEDDL